MHEAIDRAIEAGGVEGVIELLAQARTAEIHYTVKKLVRLNGGGERALVDEAKGWAARPEPAARHVACGLLAESYESEPHKTIELLVGLVDDDDWMVREAAGNTSGRILRADFTNGLDLLREWRDHPSANVRRAVLMAVIRASQTRRLEWAEPLLKLIEPLLLDRHPTLRRNLGPFALGATLLRHYPEMTFEYIIKWSTSNDAQVLWNVAMAFSASGGPPLVKKALIILRKLSLDERRYVWRAVASAMWKLGRKRPEFVRPELIRWLEDERRVVVAREALKHL